MPTRRAARAATPPPPASEPTPAEIRARMLDSLRAWDRYDRVVADLNEKIDRTGLPYALEWGCERLFLADAIRRVCAPAFGILEDEARSDGSALKDLASYVERTLYELLELRPWEHGSTQPLSDLRDRALVSARARFVERMAGAYRGPFTLAVVPRGWASPEPAPAHSGQPPKTPGNPDGEGSATPERRAR
jgi:hypothetical protein